MASIAQKLFARLKVMPELSGSIRGNGRCRRSYAGRGMRSAGAWSWYLEHDGLGQIGSQYTMRECLIAKSLIIDHDGLFGTEVSPHA